MGESPDREHQAPPSEHDQLAHLVEVEVPALEAALAEARQERDEWKAEADRSKWPKDAAQEYFRLKAEALVLRARLDATEEALRRVEPLIDAQFEGHDGIVEYGAKVRKLNDALDIVRAALAVSATAKPGDSELIRKARSIEVSPRQIRDRLNGFRKD